MLYHIQPTKSNSEILKIHTKKEGLFLPSHNGDPAGTRTQNKALGGLRNIRFYYEVMLCACDTSTLFFYLLCCTKNVYCLCPQCSQNFASLSISLPHSLQYLCSSLGSSSLSPFFTARATFSEVGDIISPCISEISLRSSLL